MNEQIHLKIMLLFSFLSFSLEQCIAGGNCPLNQGTCAGDLCNWNSGFYSLLDPQLPPEKQIYCNYEQINVYIPLLLELFLPSLGHFYSGKYLMGIMKLSFLIIHIATSLMLFGFIGVPQFLIFLMDKFGISLRNFCPEGAPEMKEEEEEGEGEGKGDDDDEKNEDEKEDNDEDGEEGKKSRTKDQALGLNTKLMSLKFILRNRDQEENINRGGITQTKQAHNKEGDDIYTPELEQTLIDKEEISDKNEEKQETDEENEETKKEHNKILEMLFHISTIAFWSLYLLDLFMYKFKIYDDGNDVPFIE